MSSFKLELTKTSGLRRAVLDAVRSDLHRYFELVKARVKVELKPLIRDEIQRSSTYAAMADPNGLLPDLGMPGSIAQGKMDEIINEWVDNIQVDTFRDGIDIGVVQSDYSDVLDLPAATFVTPENGYTLEWLKWLLVMGMNPVVFGYAIEYGQFGRTDAAHMLKMTGANYSLPPQWAGTVDNNFVTNAIDSVSVAIERRIVQIAESVEVP